MKIKIYLIGMLFIIGLLGILEIVEGQGYYSNAWCQLTEKCPDGFYPVDSNGWPIGCDPLCEGRCFSCSGSDATNYCIWWPKQKCFYDPYPPPPIECGETSLKACIKGEPEFHKDGGGEIECTCGKGEPPENLRYTDEIEYCQFDYCVPPPDKE